MITLSKTNYLAYRDCKKNAWLKINKPEIYRSFSELSEFDQAIIDTGNEVELEARKLFPGGVLIEERNEEAADITQKYLKEKTKVIFQAAFLKDNFFAAVDILEYHLGTDDYSIYEVKASNETKDSIHMPDLAFQYVLLKKCGLKIRSANLLHLDPEYIRQGELDIRKLFIIDDMTEEIKEMAEETETIMSAALQYISAESEPADWCDCIYKGRSKHCTTFSHSNPKVPEYSVHDIARIGLSKAKLSELINREVFDIKDVPEDIKLSKIQQNQVDAYIHKKETIHSAGILEELSALAYPLYFLDYETYPCAIPRFDGFSPYQQIPFQFSLHILDKPGAELKHFEYLHTENSDPSLPFAEHLKKYIGKVGTIIVWNKKFEMKINEQLGDRLAEYRAFIEDINSRVYDLMDIFSKQYYVHQDFKGSTSIKKVLPVLAPDLSYKDLAIQEGGTASQAWDKITMGDNTDSEKKEIAQNLKDYCKLDTYAMYAIWAKLQ